MEISISPMLLNVIIIMVLALLLVKSADFVSEAFIYISKKAGIGEFIAGFLVLAFVTSLPEISVAINSVNNDVPELSVGNLLGGSFILMSLVTGLNTLVHDGLPFKGKFQSKEVFATLVTIVLPVIVLIDQNISAGEGIVMILVYCALAYQLYRIFKRKSSITTKKDETIRLSNVSTVIIKTTLGIAGLIFFSDMIVDTAINTAHLLNVNAAVVGLFILALGTNLPELTILLRAKKGPSEKFAVGDLLGSASINTAIIGMIGLFSPHVFENFADLIPVLVLLSLAVILFLIFERTRSEISKQEGILLISVYAAMVVIQMLYLFMNPLN